MGGRKRRRRRNFAATVRLRLRVTTHTEETMAPNRNEGEGNRTADRKYRQGVQEHMKQHDVQDEAKRARDAIDSPEGDALRRAEEEGKSHAKGEDPTLKR